MAVDMFLNIEGVKGESRDKAHKEEIDILAWSWGISQTGTMHMGGGGGTGKANVQDISVTKYVDKSSPEMISSLTTGKHFPKATLTCRKAGGKPVEYLIIEMDKVLITSMSTGGSGGEDQQTENVTFNFEKFVYKYTPQKEDGSKGATIEKGYHIAENEST
jgi:type VI secretion system secreted protein Hcp